MTIALRNRRHLGRARGLLVAAAALVVLILPDPARAAGPVHRILLIMDATPAIIIFVLMLLPIANSLRVHPVVLGGVVVMTIALGLLTLPYGLWTLVACGVAKVPVSRILLVLHIIR